MSTACDGNDFEAMSKNTIDLEEIYRLRHELHRHPELSLKETWTREHLMGWIRAHTKLAVYPLERGFLAVREPDGSPKKGAIAFRADYDALPIEEDGSLPYCSVNAGASHKCGHDGHSAALCGLALMFEGMRTDRRVVFIFQGAEEIGQGGESCAEALEKLGVSEVYAFHNRSGYPERAVVVKRGVTQCASEGLTVSFAGRASHASAPEDGVNPAAAAAKLVLFMETFGTMSWDGLVMTTVVHVGVGSPDFGISPGEGLVDVTLRAENEPEMVRAELAIFEKAQDLGAEYGLRVSFSKQDVFPETVNHEGCARKVAEAAKRLGFDLIETEEVWRASEDFGYYTKRVPGAMFYIGNGENYPALHTAEYDFNDVITETAVRMFAELISM